MKKTLTTLFFASICCCLSAQNSLSGDKEYSVDYIGSNDDKTQIIDLEKYKMEYPEELENIVFLKGKKTKSSDIQQRAKVLNMKKYKAEYPDNLEGKIDLTGSGSSSQYRKIFLDKDNSDDVIITVETIEMEDGVEEDFILEPVDEYDDIYQEDNTSNTDYSFRKSSSSYQEGEDHIIDLEEYKRTYPVEKEFVVKKYGKGKSTTSKSINLDKYKKEYPKEKEFKIVLD